MILRHSAALLLGAACLSASCGDETPRGRISGVLVTLDTTNHDALGAFGAPLGTTPHLDALARDALAFTRARSVAPLTAPAHASMLTGLWPPRHTVRDNAWRPLPASAHTLAELAHEAGYQTAAFLSAVVLAAPYGLDQGFDVYDDPANTAHLATEHMAERSAEETVAHALAWLASRDEARPFFLWVHCFEPHAPYEPGPSFVAQAGGNAYLGEVARMDAALGELFDSLRDQGLSDETLVVVVGDHGEALGRHGEPTHSVLCYDDTLRVPLLVRRPGKGRAERSDATVSIVDVFPTFVEGLGLDASALGAQDGVSLLAARHASERKVYFESYAGFLNYGWSPIAGWVGEGQKYLHGTSPELYDLTRDPLERTNSWEGAQDEALRSALAQLVAGAPLEAETGGVERELVEGARALGYAAAADPQASLPAPDADTALPDPRTRLDELERFYAATLLRNQGRRGEAIEAMRAVVAGNPQNVYARNVLASFLLEEGRPREAAEELLSLPPERQERLNVQDCLGHAFEALGELPRALAHFERALEMKPGDEHQVEDVARVKGKVGAKE